MSATAFDAAHACQPMYPPAPTVGDITRDLLTLDQLVDRYGEQAVADSVGDNALRAFCDGMRDRIDASNMPQWMKDAAHAELDRIESTMMRSSNCECDAAVAEAGVGDVSEQAAVEATSSSEGSSSGPTSAELMVAGNQSLADGAEDEKGKKSKAPAAASGAGEGAAGGAERAGGAGSAQEGQGELDQAEGGEGTAGAGGGSGVGGSGGDMEFSGENFFMALAAMCGSFQKKWLDLALKHLSDMNSMAGGNAEDGGGTGTGSSNTPTEGGVEAADPNFVVAQSKFQAAFQLFNMAANGCSTALKSLGEGLTAIARKQ